MEPLIADVRQAVRHAHRAPVHAFGVVASVTLGVAAVTAVFTVLDAVVLQPLPYPDEDALVLLYETNPERGWDRAEVAPANFLDWRSDVPAFSDITAFQNWLTSMTLTGNADPRAYGTLAVFGNFFDVLGATPELGRLFREEETWAGSDDVVILSHVVWRRDFGADPAVVGRRVVLEGRARTVVGVLPATFIEPPVIWSSPSTLADEAELFVPFGWDRAAVPTAVFFRQAHVVRAVGRLRADATLDLARTELSATARRLEAEYPATNRAMGVFAETLRRGVADGGRGPLVLLLGAASLVLLLTCANVGNLMMARAAARAREMAVRSALGARGRRLARQVLAEAALLGLAGGIAGLVVAAWTTDALLSLAPASLPRMGDAGVNLRAFGVAMAASIGAALLFGLAPAVGAARPHPELTLRAGRSTDTRTRRRGSASLVAVQVALAITVLAGAGLLFRTFRALRDVDPGFDAANVAWLTLTPPAGRYTNDDAVGVQEELARRIAELPGVERAAIVSRLPLTGSWGSDAMIEGVENSGFRGLRHREVGPGYFAALDIPVLAGRGITDADAAGPPIAVINRTFAERHFRGEDPVGRRISFDYEPGPDVVWRTVVGVVEDTRGDGLRADPVPEAYGAVAQDGGRSAQIVVRTALPAETLAPRVRGLLREMDPDLPMAGLHPLTVVVDEALARDRFLFVLMTTFAGLALVLATIGVYGTTANAVRHRTGEIGVRMALGADRRSVAGWVLRTAMTPVLIGAVVGLAGALIVGRLLRSLLFGVSAFDPLTLGAVALTLLAVPLLAAMLPARRAAALDPLRVLKGDD